MIIPNIWENKTCSKPPTSHKSHNLRGRDPSVLQAELAFQSQGHRPSPWDQQRLRQFHPAHLHRTPSVNAWWSARASDGPKKPSGLNLFEALRETSNEKNPPAKKWFRCKIVRNLENGWKGWFRNSRNKVHLDRWWKHAENCCSLGQLKLKNQVFQPIWYIKTQGFMFPRKHGASVQGPTVQLSMSVGSADSWSQASFCEQTSG